MKDGWMRTGWYLVVLAIPLGLALFSCTEPDDDEPPVKVVREWHYLGLGEESITAIAVDPDDDDILYAGSGSNFSDGTVGGIFKSADGGAVWDTLVRGVTVRDIDFHPHDSQTIYVTCGINYLTPQGLLRTKDGGLSWEWADTGMSLYAEEGLSVLAIDPMHPDTMYLGTAGVLGGGLFKSTDEARTWKRVLNNDLTNGVTAIEIDKNYPNIIYAGTSWVGAIMKSIDYGETWERLNFPELGVVYDLAYSNQHPKILCAGLMRHGFFYSLDDGQTWLKGNKGLSDTVTVSSISLALDGKIYISANDIKKGAVYISSIDPIEWSVFHDLTSNYSINVVYVSPNGDIYSEKGGIYVWR
ncbi:MAG: YCF48-related protein [bacterium]